MYPYCFCSTITCFSSCREYGWSWKEEMLIPKVIGKALIGFSTIRLRKKLIRSKNRLRGYNIVE